MCLSGIVNLISSISVIIASGVAVWGIVKWRREIQFTRKHELAEKILANAYKAVDVIETIRFPASRGDEGQTRKQKKNETTQQTKLLDNLFVIKERFLRNNDPFKELFSIRYNARVIMGTEVDDNLIIILKMPRKIFNVVDQYADVSLNPERYPEDEKIKIQKEY